MLRGLDNIFLAMKPYRDRDSTKESTFGKMLILVWTWLTITETIIEILILFLKHLDCGQQSWQYRQVLIRNWLVSVSVPVWPKFVRFGEVLKCFWVIPVNTVDYLGFGLYSLDFWYWFVASLIDKSISNSELFLDCCYFHA